MLLNKYIFLPIRVSLKGIFTLEEQNSSYVVQIIKAIVRVFFFFFFVLFLFFYQRGLNIVELHNNENRRTEVIKQL